MPGSYGPLHMLIPIPPTFFFFFFANLFILVRELLLNSQLMASLHPDIIYGAFTALGSCICLIIFVIKPTRIGEYRVTYY